MATTVTLVLLAACAAPAAAQVIGTPSPTSPANGSTNLPTTVTLTWSGVTLATSYELQVSTDNAFSNIFTDQTLTGTSYTLSGLSQGATYFWRVRAETLVVAGSWSSAWRFSTAASVSPPSPPAQIAPANGATGQPTTIAFSWNASTGATSYNLQVATDAAFTSIVSNNTAIAGTSQQVSGLSAGTTYYWRVDAANSAGTGSWSSVWSFSTAAVQSPPATPVLSSPANGATNEPTAIILAWDSASGADHYWLQVATDQAFTSVTYGDSTITSTSQQVNYLSPSTTYYWRVRGLNAAGMSNWSSAWTFTTQSTQVQPPPVPTLVSPADGATNQPTTISFQWNASANAANYFLQVATDQAFSSIVYYNYSIIGTSQHVDSLSANTTYYWHVKAVNSGGQSNWSTTWSLQTGSPVVPPAAPALLSPVDGATNQPDSVTFNWDTSSGATGYRFQLSTNTSFSSPVLDDSTVAGTSEFVTILEPGTTYFWRVLARNSAGAGGWSQAWNFTTALPLQPPSAPSLLSPPNGARNMGSVDTLTWLVSKNASYYQVAISTYPSLDSTVVRDSTASTNHLVVSSLRSATTYYWHVRAVNAEGASSWSTEWSFSTAATTVVPPAPALLSPAFGATGLPLVDTLSWSPSQQAQGYEAQLSITGDFTLPLVLDTTLSETGVVTGVLSAGSTYWWRVRGENSLGFGDWSGIRSFSTESTDTSRPVLVTPANGATGLPTTVVCSWQAMSAAVAYDLQVSADTSFGSLLFDDSTLTTDHVSVGGLQPGTSYYWHVRAKKNSGMWTEFSRDWSFSTTSQPVTSNELTIAVEVDYPTVSGNSPLKSTDYRLVGLPGASNMPITAILPGAQGTSWDAYWDNGSPSNYLVHFGPSLADSVFTFSAGRAFWIIKDGPLVVDTSVAAPPLDSTGSAGIPLHSGWNLITDPFSDSVSWSTLQAFNDLTEPLYSFRGTFEISGELVPGQGFYFFNRDNMKSVRVPKPGGNSATLRSENRQVKPAGPDWTIGVMLRSGGEVDSTAWFGVSPDATDGLNVLDFHKPLPINGAPAVYFWHPDWDKNYSVFASDVRHDLSGISKWVVTVAATPYRDATLTFNGIESVPPGLGVYLQNPVSGNWLNLRRSPVVRFVPISGTTRFQVLLGEENTVRHSLAGSRPVKFSVGANYPNPFNPTTTIPFYLGEGTHVTLTVFNIIGRRVAQVFDGDLDMGEHTVVWNGTDQRGHPMPSGVYFYRVTVGADGSEIHKMMLLK